MAIEETIPYTLLSLSHFARIMGINPVHFMGAHADDTFPAHGACGDMWPHMAWQDFDKVSHYDLAEMIGKVEWDIAHELGYWPGPVWIEQEVHRMPRHHRRDVMRSGARNVRGERVSVQADFGYFINSGRRAVSRVGAAAVAVVYSDEDTDGFNETATITVATTLTDEREIDAYFADHDGELEWLIRPARSKTLTGGNIVLVYDSWLFIKPSVLSTYPSTTEWAAIDISTNGNFVTTVDVYRQYTDFTQASAVFYWDPEPRSLVANFCTSCSGSGCPACTLISQSGCCFARDSVAGTVVPSPATYNSTTGVWDQVAYDECRDPQQVKLYYRCGKLGRRYLAGRTFEPLDDQWARVIARMTVARLERPFCSCGNLVALTAYLRNDVSFAGQDGSWAVGPALLDNPFGTKRGEIEAWQLVSKLASNKIQGGAF